VDAAMNDLVRPAFYEAYHEIVPTTRRPGPVIPTDVVGPICESGDTFCKERPLPRVKEGDTLALLSAGAYGSAMGSTYNSRPLAAEVLVSGSKVAEVRRRQALKDMWKDESVPTWLRV
jgi:diaminopimelate decarboxylase